jgi:hypothetical protein
MSDTSYTPGYWDEDEQTWVGGESLPGHQQGVLELSVKSDGKVSAKLLTSVGSRSVSGTLSWFPDEDDAESEGTFTFTAKMTKDDEECDVEFYPDGTISGYADTYNKPEERYDGGDVEGLRQDTALLSKSNFMDKYYTFAFNAAASGNDEQHEASGYGYLTVKTAKGLDEDKTDKEGRVIRRERYAGAMERSFFIGKGMTDSEITAKFEDGVLHLTFPKEEAKKLPEKKTIAIEG